MLMLIRRLLVNIIVDGNMLMLLNIFMVGMMWDIGIKCPLDSVLTEVNRFNIMLVVVLMVQLMVHLFMIDWLVVVILVVMVLSSHWNLVLAYFVDHRL